MDRHVILYDEDCGFCRWSLDKILAWDKEKRLRPLPLQSPEADQWVGDMDRDTRYASWHLVTPDGRVYSAGAAAEPLAKLLPGGAPVAVIAGAFPKTTDRIYRWVARNRDRIGERLGTQACSVDPSKRG